MSNNILATKDDGLTTITLDRPDALNALDSDTRVELRDAVAAAANDSECRAVLLAGSSSRAFCVGQDLKEHVNNLAGDDPLAGVREHYNPIASQLFMMDKPIIAAIRGAAAGAGASLAFLADFRIGGPSTSFTMAFSAIGLAADTGASYTLPRIVGHSKATQMLLLNETVRSTEAAEIGLLTQLCDSDDDVLATATALATGLANGPTVAYEQIKQQLRFGAQFEQVLDVEAAAQAKCGFTEDHPKAVDAFVHKQSPTYVGR